MNINTLKLGFINYLQELQKQEGNKEAKINANSDLSIFSYANEFKDYIEKEIDTAELEYSLAAMSINEILNLDFENGKLISTDNISEEIDKGLNKNNENKADKSKGFFASMIGTLLNHDEVKNVVDKDKDGNYSEDELNNFFTSMNGIDENKDSLSFNDIFSTIDKISNNDFNTDNKTPETSKVKEKDDTESDRPTGGSSTGSSGGSSASSSGGFPSGASSSKPEINSSDLLGKDPSNMSLKELETLKPVADKQLSEKQSDLNATIDGSSPEMQKLQTNVDNAFNAYTDMLEEVQTEEETFAEDISAKKEEIDNKQQTINEKDIAIEGKNSEIENHKANIQVAESSIGSLESSKTSLNTALSDEDADKAAIQAQIDSINSQITQLQDLKTEETSAQTEAENEKATLEGEKETAQGELTELEAQLTEIEKASEKAHPEVAEARQNYDSAKLTFSTEKAEAVTKAKTDVTKAQSYINEVNNTISELNTKSVENKSQRIIDNGSSEYDEEAGNTLAEHALAEANRRNRTGTCLLGVSAALNEIYGINLSDKIKPENTYMAADLLRGNDKDFEELASHFKEVTTYTKEDLKTLPAGAIVVWDQSIGQAGHISIAVGNGKEASDHVQHQSEWDGNFTVFLPISS